MPTSSVVNSANSWKPVMRLRRSMVGSISHTLPTMWSKRASPNVGGLGGDARVVEVGTYPGRYIVAVPTAPHSSSPRRLSRRRTTSP